MTILTPSQIKVYAQKAGFQGYNITLAIAIALAESGGNTGAINHNSNGSTDYGLWQINSIHGYNPSQLFDPSYNASAAYDISGGSNWQPWTTFTSGAYKRYLTQASNASGNIPAPAAMTVDQVFTAKNLWKWYSSPVTNRFDGVSEKGEDFSAAWGTPVGCVAAGTVKRIAHNNNAINDVVEIMDGNGAVWLYQHINSKVRVGQAVNIGDIVGTENGLPVDQYSTGPHIEVRYCPPGRWSINTDSWLEPWINPASIFSRVGNNPVTGQYDISQVNNAAIAVNSYLSLSQQLHQTLTTNYSLYGIALTLDEASQFPGFVDLTQGVSPTLSVLGVTTPAPNPGYYVAFVRSVGATLTDNLIPASIMTFLILLGAMLLFLLGFKIVTEVQGEAMEVAKPLLDAAL